MSFSFIATLILILCLLGILAIFFRRIPEVLDQKENATDSKSPSPEQFDNQALLQTVWRGLKEAAARASKKPCHFPVETKDLKQRQIIAAKFARLVTPKARLQNIGAFNNLKKAAELREQGLLAEAEQLYIQVIR